MKKNELKKENQNHTSQNGITLIALIITIIAMLILVGVTINVSLNGGLFTKAKEASTGLEKTTIHEQIIMGIQLKNGKIDVEETFNEAQKTLSGHKITKKASGTNYIVLTVQGNNGTYTYTITDEEIVIGEIKHETGGEEFDRYETGLVYGKKYVADLGFTTIEIVFSKQYNKYVEGGYLINSYDFNEETNEINCSSIGEGKGILSDDGKTITIGNINFILTEDEYVPEKMENTNLYHGIYYNNGNYIGISENIMQIYGNGEGKLYFAYADETIEGRFPENNITIKSDKILEKNGIEYILIESFK